MPEHKRIIMIFEGATHVWREIYMDGRTFPEGDALNPDLPRILDRPLAGQGHARSSRTRASTRTAGSTTLVIPHTDLMKVTEKWTRPNKQTLHYEATVDDPGAYTAPFTMAWDIPWDATA